MTEDDPRFDLSRRLMRDVLTPMKSDFVGKDEIIDLLGICLVGGENLFILGPPGTAKSALVQDLSRRIEGRMFDYLLTRFTEPNELFGPFDIRKLREGELITNTEGMLPEAAFVFLDELLNANSAILNSLLMVLNERVFRRGRETRTLPTLIVVGASNRLPEDESLQALFDRFLLRVRSDNVPHEQLADVLRAGWVLDQQLSRRETSLSIEDIRSINSLIRDIDLDAVRGTYIDLVHRLRHAGIAISDRRAVKLQRLMAASAILCGRSRVEISDLWILRYIWDTEEQQEILATIVQEAIEKHLADETRRNHPRARGADAPDPERLARDLERLAERLQTELSAADRSFVHDQLGLLTTRIAWVTDAQQRRYLEQQANELWNAAGLQR